MQIIISKVQWYFSNNLNNLYRESLILSLYSIDMYGHALLVGLQSINKCCFIKLRFNTTFLSKRTALFSLLDKKCRSMFRLAPVKTSKYKLTFPMSSALTLFIHLPRQPHGPRNNNFHSYVNSIQLNQSICFLLRYLNKQRHKVNFMKIEMISVYPIFMLKYSINIHIQCSRWAEWSMQ